MKPIKELAQAWDNIEEKIRILRWAQETFLAPQFREFIELARKEAGFDCLTEWEQAAWDEWELGFSDRELVQLFLDLRTAGQSLADYMDNGMVLKASSPSPSKPMKLKLSPEQLN